MSNILEVRIMQLGDNKFRVDFKVKSNLHVDQESKWIVDYHYSSVEEARNRKEDLLKYGLEGIEIE